MSESNGASSSLEEADAIARYIFEIGHLKSTPRSGWALAGIQRPESVADHSFRTAVIGFILATQEDADPARTVLLCLFHDTPETRLGDIPSVGRNYLDATPDQVVEDQTELLPSPVEQAIGELVMAYEGVTDREARLAKDADKLECLAQAYQYVESGFTQARSWIDPLTDELSSDTAKEMAAALERIPAGEWWQGFVEKYRSGAHHKPTLA